MQKFQIIGKPLLGEKYLEGKRKRTLSTCVGTHYVRTNRRILPSLMATTYVRTHYVHTNVTLGCAGFGMAGVGWSMEWVRGGRSWMEFGIGPEVVRCMFLVLLVQEETNV